MSFYTSLNGLKNAQTDLGVISHNIANAETNGFKKSRTEFGDIVVGSAFSNPKQTVGIGATVESITQNFALGPVEQTGSALDLAINGDGFFSMKNVITQETIYTRNGSMTVDGSGFINDGSNNRLQVFPTSATGTITSTTPVDAQIPATNGTDAAGNPVEFAGITVGDDGSVTASYADGSNLVIGKVALASFIAPQGLKQIGSSNWVATGNSGTAAYGQPSTGQYGSLLSGQLERSNVDIAEELVGLITAQRNFQANAKAIDTATQISQTVIQLRS
jgi:flagellar hook protein FlgE